MSLPVPEYNRLTSGVNPLSRERAELNAAGDGTGVTVASRFGTLERAQKVFPHVMSPDDTIDWAALQSAIDAGSCYIPDTSHRYVINRRLRLTGGKRIVGNGGRRCAKRSPGIYAHPTLSDAMIASSGDHNSVEGIYIEGNRNIETRGLQHFKGSNDNLLTVRDCCFILFGCEAIRIEGGLQHQISDTFGKDALQNPRYLKEPRGAIDIAGQDHSITSCEFACRSNANTGNTASMLLRCGRSKLFDVLGEVSEMGIYLHWDSNNCRLFAVRSDLNQKQGFLVDGPRHSFFGCESVFSSMEESGKHPGALVMSNENYFSGFVSSTGKGRAVHSVSIKDVAAKRGPNRYRDTQKHALDGGLYDLTEAHPVTRRRVELELTVNQPDRPITEF